MPGYVKDFLNNERQESAHEELYSLMREQYEPEEVSRRMSAMVERRPGITAVEMLRDYSIEQSGHTTVRAGLEYVKALRSRDEEMEIGGR